MTAKLPLENMNVLVTGGGSGIGLACAASFYRDGANVTLMGRSEQRLAEARAALEAIDVPGKVSIVSGDVANETDVEQAVDSARLGGSLDILVASAGRGALSPVTATDAAEWNDVLATKIW